MISALRQKESSPFAISNIRRFIAFRVLFNSRFYYPVFTILFLDFGLSVAQFAVLNAAWAATIVLLEVPSGALADVIGRKRLLVFATSVMVVEIGIIAFVPLMNPGVIFYVFLVNRILSGLAEAAASGADEAIAYDSLKARNMESQWGRVLDHMMRYRAVGFIFAMTIGGAVYDPNLMETLCRMVGFDVHLSQEITMRFPLYLTFIMSLFALWSTLGMEEICFSDALNQASDPPKSYGLHGEKDLSSGNKGVQSPAPVNGHDPVPADTWTWIQNLKKAFAATFMAGGWILKNPFVLSVMLFGMVFDGVIRMTITLSSQYYRLVDIPESLFGIIGSLLALLGMVIPRVALAIVEKRSHHTALVVTTLLAFSGLWGMNFFWPYYGLVPAVLTSCAMYFTGFFASYYINRETDSRRRATVLSFKGLVYNISYGVLGILYALVLKFERTGLEKTILDIQQLEIQVFKDAFVSFPLLFMAGMGVMGVLSYEIFQKNRTI